MKILSTLIMLLVLAACSKPDFQDADFQDADFQDADFQDIEGNGIFLQDLNKKWLIVNYWATWCAPCRIEIPELNELSLEEKDKLVMIGVNFDQPPMSELPQQVKQMKIEFTVLRKDPSAKLGISMPEVLPTTYVFRPGGELVKTLVGPQSKEDLLSIINGH